MRWGLLLLAVATAALACAARVPSAAVASAVALVLGLALLAGGLLAALREAAWAKGAATVGAVGLLVLPDAANPLLATPAWASAFLTVLFLHRLHARPGIGRRVASLDWHRMGRVIAAVLVLSLPVVATWAPGLVQSTWAPSREAQAGGAGLLVGLAILFVCASIHLVRIALTRPTKVLEGSP